MAKTNTERLRRGVSIGLTAGALGLGALIGSACGDNLTEPEIDKKPQSTIEYIWPPTGMAPHSVNVRYSCTDDKGIKEYALTKGSEVVYRGQNPIDTTLVFADAGDYGVKTDCIDTGNQTTSYSAMIQVSQPPQPTRSFSQSATLENFIDIKYGATKENIDSAKVRVLRDSTPIDSFMVRTSPYTKTLASNPVGKYDFNAIWKTVAGKDTSVTISINVPLYAPDAPDLSGVRPRMNEGDSVVAHVKRAISKNKEKNPVKYTSVRSLDGKTNPSIGNFPNDTIVNIRAVPDSVGEYQIELGFGDGQTGTVRFGGSIDDLLDVEVFLEDNEQHQRWSGVARVYKAADSTKLGEIIIGSDGRGSKRLEQRIADLTGDILVQAQRFPNGDTTASPTSYVRTVKLPVKDQRGLLLRVVPCAPYCADREKFKQFMLELAGNPPDTRFDFKGEYIPGFSGYKGIVILSENPFGLQYGTFTFDQQTNIRNKILDPNDISEIIGDYIINPDSVLIGNYGHFTLDSTQQKIIPNSGWIIVSPKTNMKENGLTERFRTGRSLVSRGVIYLKLGAGDGTISHEFGHMFIGGGHPTIFGPDQTIMNSSTTLSTPGPADKKAGKIVYEPTFMVVLPEFGFPSVDDLENILGLRLINK